MSYGKPHTYKVKLDAALIQITKLKNAAKDSSDMATQYRLHNVKLESQLRNIKNAAISDPHDERDISVSWLREVIHENT
jgi:hypothetical protein